MTNEHPNPPAFPLAVGTPADDWGQLHEGMTLRDWFAGQALAGNLAACMTADIHADLAQGTRAGMPLARAAYAIADAMLAARTQTGAST